MSNYIQYKNRLIAFVMLQLITIIFFNEYCALQIDKKTKDLTYSLSTAILTAVKGHLK